MIPAFSPLTGLSSMVKTLFSAGEPGVWYDPSDLSTMYQDAAGTIPVTAVGQPVGLILDKSGRGNHANQSTTASRPTLSARVNLLTNTEAFESASWPRYQSVINNNYVTGPFGRPADLLVADTNYGEHIIWQNMNFVSGLRYRFSVYLKNHTKTYGIYRVNDSAAFGYIGGVTINLNNNTITGDSGALNRALTSLGDGWFKAEFEAIATSTRVERSPIGLLNSDGTALYSGDGVSGVYIGAFDLRVANESANLPAYQRVNTNTDYDTVGFPYYLSFDGVDDYLSTGSIDFTATDKMTVFAGVRKLSDASPGILIELGSIASYLQAGSFAVTAPESTTLRYAFYSRGSTQLLKNAATSNNAYLSPVTNTLVGRSDIAADLMILNLNGTQAASIAGDQGTGNYGNHPLYIGRRGGTQLPFNGHLYGLIVRGAATDDLHLTHAEKYLAYKSGVTL